MHILHIRIGAQYLLNNIWEIWRFAPDWSAIQLPGLESQKKKFYRFSFNSVTLLLKSSTRNKIKLIFWISAGICCQKIHRRGSGGWKEMWSRCFAHSMQCLTPLSMQWLSCSLILEAEKSHLIVSSSTCFGSLFHLVSEKLGHSNNMICRFICFSFTFWNLSFLQVIAVLLCGSSQGRPSLLGAAGEDHHHHHEEHHHHEPHQVFNTHEGCWTKDKSHPGSGLLLLWLRLPAGGRKESWVWWWVLWGHHPCQGLQLPIWGFQHILYTMLANFYRCQEYQTFLCNFFWYWCTTT